MAGKLADGGGGKRGGYSTNSEPNVIPFIDIMLVLLIIFMVAAPRPTVDIKVDLPPPGPSIPSVSENKPTLVALVDDAGSLSYFVEGEEVAFTDLSKRLLKVVPQRNPIFMGEGGLRKVFEEGKVYVQADQDTQYTNVIELMNEINTAGFTKVSLVAESADF